MNWTKYLWGSWSWSRPLKSLAWIYGILAIVAYCFGPELLFRPPDAGYTASETNVFSIATEDHQQIGCLWQAPPHATSPVIFFAHGNAEDLSDGDALRQEWKERGYGVFFYDYPGYGISTGKPNEASVTHATNAAWKHLTKTLAIDPQRIIIIGRSVGSGPAVALASQQPHAGLVLISPFHSAFRCVTRVPLFLGDLFPNIERIPQIKTPLLIIHGERDRVIPFSQGRSLFEKSPSLQKTFLPLPRAGHNDLFEEYEDEIYQAIDAWCPVAR